MAIADRIFFNFFALAPLIVSVFVGFIAFLLFNIKKKSRATVWLGLLFSFMVLFYAPYVLASAYFDSLAAFHRWGTVLFVLLAEAFATQYMLSFPQRKYKRLSVVLLIVQVSTTLLASGYFFYVTLNAPRVYHFDGHYWDFDADLVSKYVGFLILLNMFVVYSCGVAQAIGNKGSRWVLIGMTVFFMIGTLVPGITNVLSRDGALDRGTHQIVITNAVIVGFFSLAILYINSTTDRTTFMAKIVGISLATFMLLLVPISLFTLQDKESAYDQVHRRDTRLVLAAEDYRPEDVRYRATLSLADGTLNVSPFTSDVNVHLEEFRTEFLNSAVRGRIMALDIQNLTRTEFDEQLENILNGAHPNFAAYASAIRDLNSQLAPDVTDRAAVIMASLDGNSNRITYRTNKLRAVPEANFREGAIAFLTPFSEKPDEAYRPFASVLLERIQASASEGAVLKEELLEMLRPMKALGERHYRHYAGADIERDPYVGFMQLDLADGKLYEVGYSYIAYRNFVHEAANKLVWILLAVVIIVALGFRLFFYGALVSPLERLLSGVTRVNEGDLQVEVPVKVEDEIGFLSRSFNGMVASIRSAQKKLRDYAENLEEKVKERTAELKNTLDEVQKLKTQQDGDYFLTAMLTRPLGSNHYTGERAEVDFLIRQKKKFEFRNRHDEIGGDLCSAHRLILMGRPYLVFMNADAMGKSIQGAGGALVLGAVFESMVNRTQLSPAAQNVYPERWLKNSFIELHKIFESFDGSMLISIVFGLMDEESGFLYYLNAEHPSSVLYRDGKASFLDEDIMFRKLGTTGMGTGVFIQSVQLYPGDIFVAGSDGRDDVLLGHREDGERIINEDEQQFLVVVEESNADLTRMFELISGSGEITDDFSLMRIEYTGPDMRQALRAGADDRTEEIVKVARKLGRDGDWQGALDQLGELTVQQSSCPIVMKEFAVTLFKLKEYSRAITFAQKYVDLNPADTDMLYLTSFLYKRLRDLDAAADFGERVRLREPQNVQNLVHLADIYLTMGVTKRADKMVRKALSYEPGNPHAMRMQEHVQKRGGVEAPVA